MPESSGYTGTWSEGVPQFNNTTWTIHTVNPESNGQTYNTATWPNVMAADVSAVEQRWREENHAENAKEYLSGFEHSISKPHTYTASSKSPELTEIWSKVTQIIRDGSWDAIFAPTEEAFTQTLADMYQQAAAAGYETCVQWCEKEAALRRSLEE